MTVHITQDEETLLWQADCLPGWPGGTLAEAIKYAWDYTYENWEPSTVSNPTRHITENIRIDFPVELKRRAEMLGVNLYAKATATVTPLHKERKSKPVNLTPPGGAYQFQI